MITDKLILKTINKAIKNLKTSEIFNNYEGGIDGIIDEIKWIYNQKVDIEKSVIKKCNKEISVALLFITTLAYISISIEDKNGYPLLPEDWIEIKVNPNIILGSLLSYITNNALAAVYLSQSGLDPSAGVILRTLHELCYLTLVVMADKNMMELYYLTENEEGTGYKIWDKHFRPSKINKDLAKIEVSISGNEEFANWLKQKRTEFYSEYTSYTHSTYTTCMCAAYAKPTNKAPKLGKRLLGAYSISIKNTLESVSDLLFYFLEVFFGILIKIHKISVPNDNVLWKDVVILRRCAHEAYMEYKRFREGKNREKSSMA